MTKKIEVQELRRINDITNNAFKEQPTRLYSGHIELRHSEKLALAYLKAIKSVLNIENIEIIVHEDRR